MISNNELNIIEKDIDKINYELTFLEPSNPFEAATIDCYECKLEAYINKLEASIKETKISNSGLKLVQS